MNWIISKYLLFCSLINNDNCSDWVCHHFVISSSLKSWEQWYMTKVVISAFGTLLSNKNFEKKLLKNNVLRKHSISKNVIYIFAAASLIKLCILNLYLLRRRIDVLIGGSKTIQWASSEVSYANTTITTLNLILTNWVIFGICLPTEGYLTKTIVEPRILFRDHLDIT